MCFFPYAPGHRLSIEYASETLLLTELRKGCSEYFGSSDLRLDIVIKNQGLRTSPNPAQLSDKISEFYILYPNSLFDISEQFGERGLVNTAEILDDSEELYKGSDNNWVYHQPGNSLTCRPKGAGIWEVEITQPHPVNLGHRTLQCIINGPVEVKSADDVINDFEQWQILLKNNLSLLRVELANPIELNESRLVRLRIKPRATSKSKHNFVPRWFKLLFKDDLYYTFEIAGPYNVEYRTRSILKSYLHQLEYSQSAELESLTKELIKQDVSEEKKRELMGIYDKVLDFQREVASGLLNVITSHVGDPKFTKIKDWRLNIQPGKFKVLKNIREYGAARICGANRNRIKEEKGRKTLVPTIEGEGSNIMYQWKTGKINMCYLHEPLSSICDSRKTNIQMRCQEKAEEELTGCYPAVGNFTIAFDCKKTNLFWRLILYSLFVYELFHFFAWTYGKVTNTFAGLPHISS